MDIFLEISFMFDLSTCVSSDKYMNIKETIRTMLPNKYNIIKHAWRVMSFSLFGQDFTQPQRENL